MEELAPADPANTADAPTKKRGGARNALNEAIGECGEEEYELLKALEAPATAPARYKKRRKDHGARATEKNAVRQRC